MCVKAHGSHECIEIQIESKDSVEEKSVQTLFF